MSIVEVLNGIRATNVTKTVHDSTYDAITVTRPELSQAGKAILITGGGTGAGLAMAKAFIGASAATILIVGRRAEVLEKARAELEDEAKALGKSPRIIARSCDIAKDSDADALWQFFADEKIVVDVYVANAAAFQEPQPLLEMGTKTVWSFFETNVRSPMYFTEKFCKQPGDGTKVSDLSHDD
jgi:NAD(P)-dependent dehydrogenase (short-subunit alcohol dehydrogenase family)